MTPTREALREAAKDWVSQSHLTGSEFSENGGMEGFLAGAAHAEKAWESERERLRAALKSVERQAAYDQEKCHCNSDRPAFEWYYVRSRSALKGST